MANYCSFCKQSFKNRQSKEARKVNKIFFFRKEKKLCNKISRFSSHFFFIDVWGCKNQQEIFLNSVAKRVRWLACEAEEIWDDFFALCWGLRKFSCSIWEFWWWWTLVVDFLVFLEEKEVFGGWWRGKSLIWTDWVLLES